MTRPISDGDRNTYLRDPEQGMKLYMSVYRPDSVWSGMLMAAYYPAAELTVSTFTGDITDVLAGYTILVYSYDGIYKGWLRARDTGSGTTLYVMEHGYGYSNIMGSDTLIAYPWRRPIAKFHRWDDSTSPATWKVDYDQAVGSNHTHIGPLARIGPPAVGFRDGSGNCTLKFVDEYTETYTGSGSISTRAWAWPESNNASTSGTAASPHSITFTDAHPKGEEYSYTATDNQGLSHTRYGVMWTHDRTGANAPYKVAQASVDATLGQGGMSSAYLYGQYSEAELPRGAYVVLWGEPNYGGTIAENLGGSYPYRSNIVFVGYVISETQVVTGKSGQPYTQLRLGTADEVMRHMSTYPVVQESVTGTPSTWNEIKDLTVQRGVASWAKWRAHVDMMDVNTGNYGDDQAIAYLDLPATTLWEQVELFYPNTLMGLCGVSLGGDLYCNAAYQLTPDDDQWLSVTLNIEQSDIAGEVMIETREYHESSQELVSGVAWETSLYSQAPGDVKGYMGANFDQPPGFAPIDQSDINEITGKLSTMKNQPIKKVSIPLRGYVPIDANPQTYVNLTIDATDEHPREMDEFDSGRDLLVTNVRHEFRDDLLPQTFLECEPVVQNEVHGVTYSMPEASTIYYGSWAPPTWLYDRLYDEYLGEGEALDDVGDMLALGDAGVALTHNAADAGVATVNYGMSMLGLPSDANIIDVAIESGEQTAWVCVETGNTATAGVYRKADCWSTGTTWQLMYNESSFRTAIGGAGPYFEPGLQHHFGGIKSVGGYVYVNCGIVSQSITAKTVDADAVNNTSLSWTINHRYIIAGTGEWEYASGLHCGAGGIDEAAPAGWPMEGENKYGLIGKVGVGGSWFWIGEESQIDAPATGTLYLSINDNNLVDNDESISANVGIMGSTLRYLLVWDGSSWTLNSNYTSFSDYIVGGSSNPALLSAFGVSANNPADVYTPRYNSGIKLTKWTDYGATWSANLGTFGSRVITYDIPYQANATDLRQWVGCEDGTIKRSTDAGANWSNITMPGGWSGNVQPRSILSNTTDSDDIAIANENGQVATSINGNAGTPTFTVQTSLSDAPNMLAGWPTDSLWLIAPQSGDIELSDDGGTTWASAWGNLTELGFTSIVFALPRLST